MTQERLCTPARSGKRGGVAPMEIRCEWTSRKGQRGVYDCPSCGCWTANLPLYKNMVCDRKDRRKANGAGRRFTDVR